MSTINPLMQMALAPTLSEMDAKAKESKKAEGGGGSWFHALAKAWGEALDAQASKIEELSGQLETEGADTPSVITELSAESMKMGFLSQSSHTSISSVSEALSTMARKQ